MNSTQIEKNVIELVKNIDKENFIYDLLMAYGISKTSVTRLKKGDFNLAKAEGEVLYKKKVWFKEAQTDQLLTTIDQITNVDEITHNPRFVIVTDYKTLLAKDIRTGVTLDTSIADLHKKYDFFLPWAGQEKYQSKNENHADRKASYEMAKLYDILVHENPNVYDDGGHNLNIFLSRLLFCFFAEDTNIFPIEGMFTDTLATHTKPDGSDTHEFLDRLFKVLNTEDNSHEPNYFHDFPYVNGGLFRDTIVSPKFSTKARKIIIECGELDWSEINPDIFGSMIQAVVNPEYRSGLGMHYTSVPNIMKVIEPLFLNELKEEFEKSKGNNTKLRKLIYRIAKIKIFDPACGSGNFLIIAYKELRRLEIEIIKEISGIGNAPIIDAPQSKLHFTENGHEIIVNAPQARMNFAPKQTELWFTEISLEQFYGIEIDDFAHEMAILSLWLAEHQMNKEFENELFDFGRSKPILPLKEAGNISCGNATRLDWKQVCPITKDEEVYILGNPPYLGYSRQDEEQKTDMDFVFDKISGFRSLDYIACWFYLGTKFIEGNNAKCALVSTNSICQGEQVSLFWPHILNKNIEIGFAYQSFKWTNNAKGNAGVSVIIVGLQNKILNQKIIFNNGLAKYSSNINPYLTDSGNYFIIKRNEPLSNIREIGYGSSALDNGNLILSSEEKVRLCSNYPNAEKYLYKLMGSQELIKGLERWAIWINDNEFEEANKIEPLKVRFTNVQLFREKSKRQSTIEAAKTPYKFGEPRFTKGDLILIPKVSSEKRNYLPIGFFSENIVVMDKAFPIYNAEVYLFGIVSSLMHMVWIKAVGGRLETRISYSSSICYNTFPFPEISEKQKELINLHVFEVLDERAKHPEKTLAQLYDPEKMPAGLKEAHHQLDLAIERCYRLKPFESDTERLEYLFKLYEQMTTKNKVEKKKTKKVK